MRMTNNQIVLPLSNGIGPYLVVVVVAGGGYILHGWPLYTLQLVSGIPLVRLCSAKQPPD